MAEKIGWYVHYKAFNYRKLGTAPPVSFKDKEKGSKSLTKAIAQKQIRHITNNFSGSKKKKTNLDQLATLLNSIIYPNENKDNTINNIKLLELLQERVIKIFEQSYPQFGISFKGGLTVYAKNKATNTTSIYATTLKKYSAEIQNIIMNTKKDDDRYLKLLDIKGKVDKTIQDLGNKKELKLNNSNRNLIDDINFAMNIDHLPYQKAIGAALEILLSVVSDWTSQRSIEEIQNILLGPNGILLDFTKEISKHKEYSSKARVDLTNFAKDITNLNFEGIEDKFGFASRAKENNKGWAGNIDINGHYYLEYDKESPDKMDVKLVANDEEMGITAKNLKMEDANQSVHLLSGTSLLGLIATDMPDFTNHWLNLVYANQTKENGDKGNINNSLLQRAHRVMKFSIFAKALTGFGTSNDSQVGDIMVFNDRTNRQVYVKDTHSIITALAKHARNDSNNKDDNNTDTKYMSIVNYPGEKNREDNKYINRSSGDPSPNKFLAKARIANLLVSIHEKKISVSTKKQHLF